MPLPTPDWPVGPAAFTYGDLAGYSLPGIADLFPLLVLNESSPVEALAMIHHGQRLGYVSPHLAVWESDAGLSENAFLHDVVTGKRIHDSRDGTTLPHLGAPEWQADRRAKAAAMAARGCTGTFLDMADPAPPAAKYLDGVVSYGAVYSWAADMASLVQAFDRPRCANTLTPGSEPTYGVADAVLMEGAFAAPWNTLPGGRVTGDVWRYQRDAILAAQRYGIAQILLAYLDPMDYATRLFVLASYLIVRDGQTWLAEGTVGGTTMAPLYFPEMSDLVDLGPATSAAPTWMDNVLVRDYAAGRVYVNIGTASATMSFSPKKGMPVSLSGDTVAELGIGGCGTLEARPAVRKVTLRPQTGAVVLWM